MRQKSSSDTVCRVVLDTNVLIASAYRPRSASGRIVDAVLKGRVILVVSEDVKREYERILPRAVRPSGQLQRIASLIARAEVVRPAGAPRIVPEDPEDDKFLHAAVAGSADAMITNDGCVVAVGTYEGVPVMRPAEFVQRWADGE